MKPATRFPLERIVILDREIREGKFPNATTLSRMLEVTPRTIQRDIEFVRDRLRAPIAFDPKRNGYAYSDPTYRLPTIALTEGELLAVFVAERAMRQLQGTPFGQDLRRAMDKILAFLSDQVTVHLSKFGGSFSFHRTATTSCDHEVFTKLAESMNRKTSLLIGYQSLNAQGPSLREIDPYHLVCMDGQWYVAAFCHSRKEVRLFVPSRISEVHVLDRCFEVPPDFRIETYLRDSLGIMRGANGETHHVRIRLRGVAARAVAERSWHESQTLNWISEEELVLSIRISHLREAEILTLGWGDLAEVLEPPELRTMVEATLRRAMDQYRT